MEASEGGVPLISVALSPRRLRPGLVCLAETEGIDWYTNTRQEGRWCHWRGRHLLGIGRVVDCGPGWSVLRPLAWDIDWYLHTTASWCPSPAYRAQVDRRAMRPSLPKAARVLVFSVLFLCHHEWRASKTPLMIWTRGVSEVALPSSPETLVMTNETVWQDLDLSSTVPCGSHRCFVPSVSNEKVGYIIARAENDALLDMIGETELAKEMALSYNAKTFHIAGELPLDLIMPEETRLKVNAQVRNPLRVHRYPDSLGANGTIDNFFDSPTVVVQRMAASPKGSVLVHCADNGFTRKQLPTFISNIIDDGLFMANLARDRYMMYKMWRGMPKLATDLQLLISTDGELFFIDFGGHASWTLKDKMILTVLPKEELCGESFDMILDALNHSDAVMSGEWKWSSRKYHRLNSY